MSGAISVHSADRYREWQHVSINVAGRPFAVATKPGVFAYGRTDPASVLLAERIKVAPEDVVVHMNAGNGLFGAVAASAGAQRVLLTDRNVLGAEAARRTLEANRTTNRPVNGEALLGHGAQPLPAELSASIVAIRIPHEKLALLQLMADALRILRVGGRCYIAGATNEGIKSAARTLESIFGNATVMATDSGHRVIVAEKQSSAPEASSELASPFIDPDSFNELPATLRGRALTLFARPGVFSWDHADEATEILADTMEIPVGAAVLDLGCGTGGLGTIAGLLSQSGHVTMVDADVEAVRSAARTAAAAGLTNVAVRTSDVASAVLGERFDVVVTNPPFHLGKATDLDVPMQFIHDAWEVLAPGGRLFLVANRTLPYERAIATLFGNIETVHDGRRFKVLAATKATEQR
jgi:16S rRNA (guanine1207-N2)-methyltransferase